MLGRKQIFSKVTKPVKYFFSQANRLSVSLFQEFDPLYTVKTQAGDLVLSCPNELSLWRAKTFFEKEPDMITWIDSHQPGEILFDVGANIGLYSLYAAKRRLKVFAFEPESQNYAILCRHIFLNQSTDNVKALQVAISKEKKFDNLFVSNLSPGYALHNFGEAVDYNKKKTKAAFTQAVLGFSLDGLIAEFGLPCPNHLKIDVDGLEGDVISGARKTLLDPRLRSVLIELNEQLPQDMEIVKTITGSGFKLERRYHAPMFDQSEHKHIYNYTFRRG